MKKYLLLTTLCASSISFAITLTPISKEAERCEYYQTKNNKTPIGKVIAVTETNDSDNEFLYLGLDGKEIKLTLQNRDWENDTEYWKNGSTVAIFKQLKMYEVADTGANYLELITLKEKNNVILKKNLLRVCQD